MYSLYSALLDWFSWPSFFVSEFTYPFLNRSQKCGFVVVLMLRDVVYLYMEKVVCVHINKNNTKRRPYRNWNERNAKEVWNISDVYRNVEIAQPQNCSNINSFDFETLQGVWRRRSTFEEVLPGQQSASVPLIERYCISIRGGAY